MVSCILPYYIHRQIYRCMNIYTYKHTNIIHTVHTNIRKSTRSLSYIHIIIYLYIHPSSYCIHTYIATLFQQHLRLRLRRLVFSQLLFYFLLLTFSFFLFLDWAKNITHIRTVRFGSVRFGFKHLVVADCRVWKYFHPIEVRLFTVYISSSLLLL